MADKETETPPFAKYHILRFKDGSYDYQCSRGLSAIGPWDQRPRFCAGVCCGRELVEQSTLDAAIEQARATDSEQLAALRVAAARAADWVEIQTAPCQHSDQPMRCTRCATRIKARELVAALREALNKGEKS